MAQEIERKYLVKSDLFKSQAVGSVRIIQGYLSSVPERTVRVRVKGDKGFLTIKGIGNESGASRYEWESEISVAEAQDLLKICEPGVIDKTRYLVEFENHTFEVDEFYQQNQGLVVAEVELTDEAQKVHKPSWLGKEVTGDRRYYNSMLMKQPFTSW
ncbi:CYTH domain-containing protein [Shewanella frigidimarina]|jgi:adenylate cyclase|uniref:Adenylate cyclase n=1 Tax=Shewanella frigidimarina (strain NCIMB 400) TaxID=318167 RepID=Q07WA8_SHEFN|nr:MULTISPECIES: CYTH domain-containing protein [Shewanella]ABI73706.1 adenylate cyclase [Shewanella frigidimarina NCIMB 400]MBB1425275.1 CYTH domain-containing protein [Shewanella sp. SG44-2]MBB1439816.1 CYTH domain-containing protein [Shewanella sp. SG41-4]PKI07011.1 CYTH domain-containing protein [Shewanella sp. 11B5]RPA36009.1 CYTH domain-containing protein [Shewanella frigidimarina]|tara:strand:- start:2457 stop:2927 length:471 start_codon:yes stop_codon:yes gene_type:complete